MTKPCHEYKLGVWWHNARMKDVDKPVHSLSLINAFDVCYLDGVRHQISISEISRLAAVSAIKPAGLRLTWSEICSGKMCSFGSHEIVQDIILPASVFLGLFSSSNGK